MSDAVPSSAPCECPAAGFCARFRREVTAKQHAMCVANTASYRDHHTALAEGRQSPLRPSVSVPVPLAVPPADDACLHRRGVAREIKCPTCKKSDVLLPVHHCTLFGECTLRDYRARSKEFEGLKVCTGCEARKPVEPALPGKLSLAFHLARDKVTDLRAGRPRRTPEKIYQIFSEHCRPCRLYNAVEGACSVCGCPVSPDEPEANRIAWAALGCSADPPTWLPET